MMMIIIIVSIEKVRYVLWYPLKLLMLMLMLMQYYDDNDVQFVVCVGSREFSWMVHGRCFVVSTLVRWKA